MKIIGCLLSILFVFCLLLPVNAAEYHYSSEDSGESAVRKQWDNLMDSIPEELRTEMDGFSISDLSETTATIREKTDIRYWLTFFVDHIAGTLPDILAGFAPLLSLMILTAAVYRILPSTASPGLQKAFLTNTSLASALFLYRTTYIVIDRTAVCLNRLCSIMNFMTPVMEAVFLSTGALTQMTVSTQAVMLFVTVAGNFSGNILRPLTNLLFTLSAVASVCDEVKMSHLIGSLRKFLQRMIQLFTMFFSFMLAAQSILAKSADSLGMRTARFALGSFIPIAGGTIAEALSTLREGMALIKNTAGIGGILLILLLLLPDILSLSLYKFTLYLAATGADLLKLDKFSAMANDIHSIIELLIAILLFTGLMFLLLLILFTRAQVTP